MNKGNWQLLLLSIVLSVVAWFFVSGRARVDAQLDLPVQFAGVPENLIIRGGLPNKISVRVRGPQGLLKSLDAKMPPVSINLASLKAGANVVELRQDAIPLSRNFEIVDIQPQRLTILADRFAVRTVNVIPRWDALLEKDWELRTALVQPELTELRGPEQVLQGIESVETQTVAVNGTRPGLVEETVALDLPEELTADPSAVLVRLLFAERRATLQFSAPVSITNTSPLQATVKPQRVLLTVEAPVSMVRDKDWLKAIIAQVQVGRDAQPGSHSLAYRLNLPAEVRVLDTQPEAVELVLTGTPAEPLVNGNHTAPPPARP
ncbi:CdaR family protein [Megalodesulfovibrio gigas]|uniref:YbbR family protein n=1 Tax=Megalodesulfovibrio gigas (strain ATCC 19364 / DSM 1382 / NCIMB 9332 / VKM B-1759) TaxID=1121448 RepID=T2G7G7_MEGG1|nr:CdaR family protein [Megalodesulfovibrio gigas]AGW12228.1 hypothetical protein DGI_0299 [Megalodesulfovibrio gigas DSM 1382 = ATCC 19364]